MNSQIRMPPTMERAKEGLKPPPEAERMFIEQASQRLAGEIQKDRFPAKQPRKRRSRITGKRSTVLAITQWAAKWASAGHPRLLTRTKRLLWWTAYHTWQVYAMVRALIGGRIDDQEFAARMAVCEDCQSLQKQLVRRSPFVKLYCGSCGCPQWSLAELRRKNRLLKWECPLNKHERLDDPTEWAAIIEDDRQWTEETPSENETVALGMPVVRQGFGQPSQARQPCGGGGGERR